MIYLKDKELVRIFIVNHLMNHEKSSNWYGMFGLLPSIYLKNSPKEYHNFDEVINELIKTRFLYEVIEFEKKFSDKPKSLGFILHYSDIQTILNNKEDFVNYQINNYRLLTINQSCEFLNISRPTLYKLIRNGEIVHVEILGKKRIQVIQLLNYISNHNKAILNH